jgi:hypothetical protein
LAGHTAAAHSTTATTKIVLRLRIQGTCFPYRDAD